MLNLQGIAYPAAAVHAVVAIFTAARQGPGDCTTDSNITRLTQTDPVALYIKAYAIWSSATR